MDISYLPGFNDDNSEELINYLKDNKAAIKTETYSNKDHSFYSKEYNLLYWAAKENKPKIITALIKEMGMDPNAYEDFSDAPLYIAARMGHECAVEALLQNGANMDPNNSPIYYAYYFNNRNMIALLKKWECDFNTAKHMSENILYYAIRNGHHQLVARLVSAEIDIKRVDAQDETPLTVAIQTCNANPSPENIEILEVILTRGYYNLNNPNQKQSPFLLANKTIQALIAKICSDNNPFTLSKLPISRILKESLLFLQGIEKQMGIDKALYSALAVHSISDAIGYIQKGADLSKLIKATDGNDTKPYANYWNNLLVACLKQDIEEVKRCLANTYSRGLYDAFLSPLDIAYYFNNKQLIALLESNENKFINSCSEAYCPMYFTVLGNNLSKVQELVEQNNVVRLDEKMLDCIQLAIALGEIDNAKCIMRLDTDALDNESYEGLVDILCDAGNMDLLYELRAKYKNKHEASGYQEQSLLLRACNRNSTVIAKEIINDASAISSLDNNERYALLLFATAHGDLKLFKGIINQGSMKWDDETKKCTLFCYACIFQNLEFVTELLDTFEFDSNTLYQAFFHAVDRGKQDICRYLMTHFDISQDAKDKGLEYLVQESKHTYLIMDLLRYGANPHYSSPWANEAVQAQKQVDPSNADKYHAVTTMDIARSLNGSIAYYEEMMALATDYAKSDKTHDLEVDKKSKGVSSGIIIDKLDQHIKYLEKGLNPFMRSAQPKVNALRELKRDLEESYSSTPEKLGAIIQRWEASKSTDRAEVTNRQLMGKHRNLFFSEDRSEVKTRSDDFIDGLKSAVEFLKIS